MNRLIFLVLSLVFSCQVAQATPDCPAGHCAKVSRKMNDFCVANGLAGKKFLVFGADGNECFCPCSCVIPTTEIRLFSSMSRIDNLKDQDQLYTPYSQGKVSVLEKKMISDVNNSNLINICCENGSSITASDNHTFITQEEMIITAEELKVGDQILDHESKPTKVTDKTQIKYTGELRNIIVNRNSSKAFDHIIANNNLLSGDWLLQSHNDSIEAGIAIRSGEIEIFAQ